MLPIFFNKNIKVETFNELLNELIDSSLKISPNSLNVSNKHDKRHFRDETRTKTKLKCYFASRLLPDAERGMLLKQNTTDWQKETSLKQVILCSNP